MILIASVGILVTLLTFTLLGGAVPVEKPNLTTYFTVLPEMGTTSEGNAPQVFVYPNGPVPGLMVHEPYDWLKQPIRIGAGITAGVTLVLGMLYWGMKRLYQQMSEEAFP
jgi:hypothetical protein